MTGGVRERVGYRRVRHRAVLLTLPRVPSSLAGPAAVGLPSIRICAVATSGFLPEAGEPRISPSLPSFPCLSHLGIPSPPVTHCPSLLWVPEQLLCLQSDLWSFYRPWLLGPTLPQLVRVGSWVKVREVEGAEGWASQPSLLSLLTSLSLLSLGRCSWVWVPLQWMPCPR